MKEKLYMVEVPIHGVQTYFVKAKTAKEAKLKVDRNDSSIEAIEGYINNHSKATKAKRCITEKLPRQKVYET